MVNKTSKNIGLLFLAWFFFMTWSAQVVAQGYSVKKIVIDAGHGGRDPGGIGKKSKEKDIALKVALLTGEYIEKYLKDVEVIYTRKTDVYIPLQQRPLIAHKAKADLFVSIHVDAVGKPSVTGASTYVLGLHRTADNLRVAQKENAVIMLEDDYKDTYAGFDPTDPASYILFNFIQNAYLEQSTDLADLIQNQFRVRVGRMDRGVHQAGFLVLRETSMPSVLVELGYITNPTEEAYLNTTKGQEYLASAIFRAIRDYKKAIEVRNHTEFKQTEKVAPAVKSPNGLVADKKHVVNPKVKSGGEVTFKLQILSSRKIIPIHDRLFHGLPDVEYYEEDNYFKYTLGDSEDIEDIKALKDGVKKRFPDAFVIGFKEGKKMAHSEVYKLLK